MRNKAMEKALQTGEAFDVRKLGKEISPGHFEIPIFVDGKDYCDGEKEEWIWSIGRDLNQVLGPIVASTGTDLYHREGWVCLWLR